MTRPRSRATGRPVRTMRYHSNNIISRVARFSTVSTEFLTFHEIAQNEKSNFVHIAQCPEITLVVQTIQILRPVFVRFAK